MNNKLCKSKSEHSKTRHCFIIGSKGIPAHYGGLETFVEKLTQYRTSSKIHYHVARMGSRDFQYEYNGAECFNISVPDIGSAKAIYYDLKALQRCIDYCNTPPHKKTDFLCTCMQDRAVHQLL